MSAQSKSPLVHFRETVKLLCGFLTAIALTNAIEKFAALGDPAAHVSELQGLSFLFLMWLMCRFFFGNIVHLNSDKDDDAFEVVFDGVTILIESLLLAYMALYAADPQRLFVYVCLLMLFDFAWWLLSALIAKFRGKKADIDRRISFSQALSWATIFAFVFLGSNIGLHWNRFFSFDYQLHAVATCWIAALNTIVDFGLNGPRYFGLKWVWPHLQPKVVP